MRNKILGWFLFLALLLPFLNIAPTPSAIHAQDAPQFQRIGRGTASCLAWSPTEDILAVGGSDGIWLYTLELTDITSIVTHVQTCPSWSPDGRYLVAERDDSIQIYEFSANDLLPTFETNLPIQSVEWSVDGDFLALETRLGFSIFDAQTQTLKLQLNGAVDVEFGSQTNPIAVAYPDHIEMIELRTYQVEHVLMYEQAPSLREIHWSPDEQHMAGVTANTLLIWESTTGDLLHIFSHIIQQIPIDHIPQPNLLRDIGRVEWSPNGKLFGLFCCASHL